jgi:PncC family amidohydrolase
VKTDVLSVPRGLLEKHGAVSEQVASLMAENVRALLKADIGVAITGVAGPAASEQKPVGMVCFAVSSAKGTSSFTYKLGNGRNRIRIGSVNRALDLVRRHILDI